MSVGKVLLYAELDIAIMLRAVQQGMGTVLAPGGDITQRIFVGGKQGDMAARGHAVHALFEAQQG